MYEVAHSFPRYCLQRLSQCLGQAGDDAAPEIPKSERPDGRIKQLAILVGFGTLRHCLPALRGGVGSSPAEYCTPCADIRGCSDRSLVFPCDISRAIPLDDHRGHSAGDCGCRFDYATRWLNEMRRNLR